jgi:hypothetical protein
VNLEIQTPITPQDVLAKALESIHKRGWAKGMVFNDYDGSACALGHIKLAIIDLHMTGNEADKLRHKAERLLTAKISEIVDDQYASIPGFNDNPRRQQEEVEEAFKLAIEAGPCE